MSNQKLTRDLLERDLMPIILLLEEDDETRRPLVSNLRKRGYKVIVVVNLENVVDWFSSTVVQPDILLINQVDTPISEYLATVRHIYRQIGFDKKLDTVILVEKYAANLRGTVANLGHNQYILYLEDAEQLFVFLHHLCFKNI